MCGFLLVFFLCFLFFFFFFQAEDGIRDPLVTGVQTCALPISGNLLYLVGPGSRLARPGHRRHSLAPNASVARLRTLGRRRHPAPPRWRDLAGSHWRISVLSARARIADKRRAYATSNPGAATYYHGWDRGRH